ncbi:MAG: alpha/beta hydrolase [Calditrichales bacterium]|nr:alpha/beta hydrolase [Calditrichales bacterium]
MKPSNLIQVRSYGTGGSYVVLLHGGPGAPGDIAPLARHLQNRFRVLEPLQRISGGVPLTVAGHVADLYDVLRDPVQESPIRLVGHSWGAMLALTYAARYPAEIDRVVIIGCGTFDNRSRETYQNSMAQRMDPDTQRRINSLKAQLANEKDRQRRNELFTKFGAIYTRIQSFNPFPAKPNVLDCDEGGYRETWKDALSLQERGVQPAEFTRIQSPVIMIHGDDDPHPGSLIYKSLTPFIPNIQYRELPRCGHTPWIEREAKDRFYEILFECLA